MTRKISDIYVPADCASHLGPVRMEIPGNFVAIRHDPDASNAQEHSLSVGAALSQVGFVEEAPVDTWQEERSGANLESSRQGESEEKAGMAMYVRISATPSTMRAPDAASGIDGFSHIQDSESTLQPQETSADQDHPARDTNPVPDPHQVEALHDDKPPVVADSAHVKDTTAILRHCVSSSNILPVLSEEVPVSHSDGEPATENLQQLRVNTGSEMGAADGDGPPAPPTSQPSPRPAWCDGTESQGSGVASVTPTRSGCCEAQSRAVAEVFQVWRPGTQVCYRRPRGGPTRPLEEGFPLWEVPGRHPQQTMFEVADLIAKPAFYVAADQWNGDRIVKIFGTFATAQDFLEFLKKRPRGSDP